MVTKLKIQFDLSKGSTPNPSLEQYATRFFHSEGKLLKSLDKLDIEDVAFQDLSVLEMKHEKLPMVAMFLCFDHPEDAATFEQRFPEMIVK